MKKNAHLVTHVVHKDVERSRIEGVDIYVNDRGRRFVKEDGQWYSCSSNGTIEEPVKAVIDQHRVCFG